MRQGSKHGSEASFSFQINDAVKGDEEFLLAEDDFLRDVNDYTIATPAPPTSRTAILERAQQELTLGQAAPRTSDRNADTSLLPKPFTPSSPAAHHHEGVATQGLNTPKHAIHSSKKASTPKPMSSTLARIEWPSPTREKRLPYPVGSPAISRLANLREEIMTLGGSGGLFAGPVEPQQDARNSDIRASSENSSPLNSNMPTPTKLQNTTQIRAEAPDPSATVLSATQSTPAHEPILLSSTSPRVKDKSNEPAITTTNVESTSEQGMAHSHRKGHVDEPDSSRHVQSNLFPPSIESGPRAETHQVDDCIPPLTVSQLSPRKLVAEVHSQDLGPMLPPTSSTSPMRPPRKRPASNVTSGCQDERGKKGKTVPRTTRDLVATGKKSATRNPSWPTRRRAVAGGVDRGEHSTTARRRLVGSGSGSRLRSSQASSSAAAAATSSIVTESQSQKVDERVSSRNERRNQDDVRCEDYETMETKDGSPWVNPLSTAPDVKPTACRTREALEATGMATSQHHGSSTEKAQNGDDNFMESISEIGTTSRANAARPPDLPFRFRSETRQHAEEDDTSKSGTRLVVGTSMSSSSSSNSRSIGRMTRSQFKYSQCRPIPDYKAQHAQLESSLAHRKENIAPVVPFSFELHTAARAKERERFDATVKEKEEEMEREREANRREREEEEEQETRELRRKAIPKANTVPEWYKAAPRRKRRVEEAQGGER